MKNVHLTTPKFRSPLDTSTKAHRHIIHVRHKRHKHSLQALHRPAAKFWGLGGKKFWGELFSYEVYNKFFWAQQNCGGIAPVAMGLHTRARTHVTPDMHATNTRHTHTHLSTHTTSPAVVEDFCQSVSVCFGVRKFPNAAARWSLRKWVNSTLMSFMAAAVTKVQQRMMIFESWQFMRVENTKEILFFGIEVDRTVVNV